MVIICRVVPPGRRRLLLDDDPQTIGRCQLTGRLGAGAMARVYLGETPDGRQVAIKVVRAELAHDDGFRRRFRQEVAAVGRVRGPHTAALIDADSGATQRGTTGHKRQASCHQPRRLSRTTTVT
jgi:hypothetical protein